MIEPNLPELAVADYNQALQRSQGMEGRGDFQFKGIYKLLVIASEWAYKFSSNKALPTEEQLEKESSIEPEKLNYFLSELCFKANPPFLKKLSGLEFSPNEMGDAESIRTFLKHFTVFVRPITADGTTSYRYVIGLNEKSSEAITKYFREKRKYIGREKFKNFIKASVDANRLFDTYASSEIGNLFQCKFDKQFPGSREITLHIHLKEILRKLVDDKVLFFLRNEKANKVPNKNCFYFNVKEEILDRINAYTEYVRSTILPDLNRLGVIGNIEESDWEHLPVVASKINSVLDSSHGDQKDLVEEWSLLAEFYNKEMEKEKKEERKKSIAELLNYIKTTGRIVDFSLLRIKGEPLDDEYRNTLLQSEDLLFAEYSDKGNLREYLLHKEAIPSAVEMAKKIHTSTKNDAELRILALMKAYQFTNDEATKTKFEQAELFSLFEYLPFFTKLWRMIMGRFTVSKREAEIIRQRILQAQAKALAAAKQKEIKRKTQELAQERVKQKMSKEKTKVQGSGTEDSDDEIPGSASGELSEEEKQNLQTMEGINAAVDEAWESGVFPDREYLLKRFNGILEEDKLVMFMKKYGGKSLFSYQVRNQGGKYKWPVLITRSYLKKYGNSLLSKAKQEFEKQSKEQYPDQDKFDMAVSLLEFLERILPKIR